MIRRLALLSLCLGLEVSAQVPVFTSTPNPRGVVGVAYRVTAEGRVAASGGGTLVYATCDTPPAGFGIHAASGEVSWTPTNAGSFSICLSATNEEGSAQQSFVVNVAATAVEVVARLTLTPTSPQVLVPVTLDASSSTTSGEVLGYRWRFGDGAEVLTSSSTTQHTYGLPGSFRAEVTVLDAQGIASSASARVEVSDATGQRAPSVSITATATSGEGQLETTLGCDCTPGSAELVSYTWELGTGETVSGPTLSRWFSAGRYQVRLAVVDANGLIGSDQVEIVVNGSEGQVPPACRPSASPASGVAPLSVEHQANARPGSAELTEIYWELEGEVATGERVTHLYEDSGWQLVKLKVKDANELTCHATVPVVTSGTAGEVPPVFLQGWSEATLACGEAFVHEPTVAGGGGTRTFSLNEAPQGMTVEPATGRVSWMPAPWQSALDASSHTAQLIVSSGSGTAHQSLYVTVQACPAVELGTFGCGVSGAAAPLLGLALLLLARRRRAAR